MKGRQLAGIIILVLGLLGLAYDRFTYVKERHTAEIGPLSVEINERETVNVPLWVAIGAIAVGAGLALSPARRA